MGLPIYTLECGEGMLSLSPRPSADTISSWIVTLCEARVTHVVSLLAQSEIVEHGLQDEGDRLKNADIAFLHFPIEDFGIPNCQKLNDLIERLLDVQNAGGHTLIHCAKGVGRTGTIASCLLIALGRKAGDAVQIISDARGQLVPETDAQRQFILDFAAQWVDHRNN